MENEKPVSKDTQAATQEVSAKTAPKEKRRENTRVSKKIDLNTVEVEFGKDAKVGSTYMILDNGRYHGEVTFDGEEITKVVELENFLPRGSLHNFSVEPK